jgi:N-ethylmaleimide reductase
VDTLVLARRHWHGTLIANSGQQEGWTREHAEGLLRDGRTDLVSFGRPFTSNPDLPIRPRAGTPLTAFAPATFYEGGERGYADYEPLGAAALIP